MIAGHFRVPAPALILQVASHVLEYAICGPLAQGRTRIVVTHHEGEPNVGFRNAPPLCASALLTPPSSRLKSPPHLPPPPRLPPYLGAREAADVVVTLLEGRVSSAVAQEGKRPPPPPAPSHPSPAASASASAPPLPLHARAEEPDVRRKGRIRWRVYQKYLQAAGGWATLGVLAALALMQARPSARALDHRRRGVGLSFSLSPRLFSQSHACGA